MKVPISPPARPSCPWRSSSSEPTPAIGAMPTISMPLRIAPRFLRKVPQLVNWWWRKNLQYDGVRTTYHAPCAGWRPARRRVFKLEQVRSPALERDVARLRVIYVGQAVALLDALLGEQVLILALSCRSHQAPLVRDEVAARLDHTEDLRVDVGAVGRVAAGLDGIAVVEGCVGEGHLVEVGLDEAARVRHLGPCRRRGRCRGPPGIATERHALTREPVKRPMLRSGPPMPQPQSRMWSPGLRADAHRQVVLVPRDRRPRTTSSGSRSAKWNDGPSPTRRSRSARL